MPLTEPIIEQIAQRIVTDLQAITTTNGYWQTVTVARPTRMGSVKPVHNLVVLTQGTTERMDETPPGKIAWTQQFQITCIVRTSEASTDALDKLANRFRSDIEKALMADPTLNNLAQRMELRAPEFIDTDDGQWGGIIVNVEIDYETLSTSPYS